MPSFLDTGLPVSVQSRIADRLSKITPDVIAIREDLGEFGFDYFKIELGATSLIIASAATQFKITEHAAGHSTV